MKSTSLFILFLLYLQLITAQTFTETFDHPFPAAEHGSIVFSDVDNDQDEDVIITGTIGIGLITTKLYFNDGNGNFTEAEENPFDPVSSSDIAFADVDGDQDEDVFIVGSRYGMPIVKLYTNDGEGHFSEVTEAVFQGVYRGAIAFSDIDNDGDEDVLITGLTDPGYSLTKLYRNDGLGNFSVITDSGLDDAHDGSIAFADIDGDNDEDVFIVGSEWSSPYLPYWTHRPAKIYLNDGQGYFSLQHETPFDNKFLHSASFADVDGDEDEDLLVTGVGESLQIGDTLLLVGDSLYTDIYTNDGEGNFTRMEENFLAGATYGSAVFADIDGDTDQDVFITGATGPYEAPAKITKLYTNDGQGIFTEVIATSFEGVDESAVAFSDIDGDDYLDLLMTGSDNERNRVAKLYLNDMVSAVPEISASLNLKYTLSPNPSTGEQLDLNIMSTERGRAIIKGYDMYGRVVFQQAKMLTAGLQLISIDVKNLQKGTYLVEVNNGQSRVVQKLLIH